MASHSCHPGFGVSSFRCGCAKKLCFFFLHFIHDKWSRKKKKKEDKKRRNIGNVCSSSEELGSSFS